MTTNIWTDCLLGVLPYNLVEKIDDEVSIPSRGRVLLPGEMAITEADGFPLIIATSGRNKNTIVAHSPTLDVISSVVEMFRRRGVQPQNILMKFFFYSRKSLVEEFAWEAHRKGVYNIHIGNPLAEFLVLHRISYLERSFLIMQMPEEQLPFLRLSLLS